MSRRYKFNIRSTTILLLKKYFCKSIDVNFNAKVSLTDLVILAKAAAQIAIRKKYCTCAAFTNKAGFFPLMQAYEGDFNFVTCSAKSNLIESVNTASSRA